MLAIFQLRRARVKSAIKQHLVLPHIKAEILDILEILETCERRPVSISSSGEPTCCFELETTHFRKLHNKNVQTGARVFIGVSLHLSIDKSFAIKSYFINVNKYIVIVNEHFTISMIIQHNLLTWKHTLSEDFENEFEFQLY